MTYLLITFFDSFSMKMQGERSCLLIPNPSATNFPWCPKDLPLQELKKLSPLIQANPQVSSFHIDPSGMPGFIAMSSKVSDETCKICLVAARPTTTLRRYLRIVAKSLNNPKRAVSQEIILHECLDLVQRGHMTMDILLPDTSAHFLRHALYHIVVTVHKRKPLGKANLSFITGAYSASEDGPPLLHMDPEQDPNDTFRLMVYSVEELEAVELKHMEKCVESTKSLKRAREIKKLNKEKKIDNFILKEK